MVEPRRGGAGRSGGCRGHTAVAGAAVTTAEGASASMTSLVGRPTAHPACAGHPTSRCHTEVGLGRVGMSRGEVAGGAPAGGGGGAPPRRQTRPTPHFPRQKEGWPGMCTAHAFRRQAEGTAPATSGCTALCTGRSRGSSQSLSSTLARVRGGERQAQAGWVRAVAPPPPPRPCPTDLVSTASGWTSNDTIMYTGESSSHAHEIRVPCKILTDTHPTSQWGCQIRPSSLCAPTRSSPPPRKWSPT